MHTSTCGLKMGYVSMIWVGYEFGSSCIYHVGVDTDLKALILRNIDKFLMNDDGLI